MKASSNAMLFGAVLFVLPIPGTVITGGLVILAGAAAKYLGS